MFSQFGIKELSNHATQEALARQLSAPWVKQLSAEYQARVAASPGEQEACDRASLASALLNWEPTHNPAQLFQQTLLSPAMEARCLPLQWVNSVSLADAGLVHWLTGLNIHSLPADILRQMRPVLAQSLYDHIIEGEMSLAPLLQLMDDLVSVLLCWYPGLGRKGEREIDKIGLMLAPLLQAPVSLHAVEHAGEAWQHYAQHQQSQLHKLTSRLEQMVESSLAANECQRICCQLVSKHVSGKKLPPILAEFISGPWLDSLKNLYLTKGERSALWRQAESFTQALVTAAFPVEGSEPSQAINEIRSKFSALLVSLNHAEGQRHMWLDQIEQMHDDIMHGRPITYSQKLSLPYQPFGERCEIRVSATLIEKVHRLKRSEWFVVCSPQELRVQILLVSEKVPWVVFNNIAGQKVLELSVEEAAYQLSSGILVPIRAAHSIRESFAAIIQNATESRRQMMEHASDLKLHQEVAARERAREKARAEAMALKQLHAEEKQRFEQAKQEHEEMMRQLMAEKEQLAAEKRRLEADKRVLSMPVGTRIRLTDSEEQSQSSLTLAVRLESSQKLLFTDELGMKRLEIKVLELVDWLVDGKAEILGNITSAKDTLAKVVTMRRPAQTGSKQ